MDQQIPETIPKVMMTRAAGEIFRLVSEFTREFCRDPDNEDPAAYFAIERAKTALMDAMFARWFEIVAALERHVDYCMPGTIRIAEHDLHGVMAEKSALSENLKTAHASCTELIYKRRQAEEEVERLKIEIQQLQAALDERLR